MLFTKTLEILKGKKHFSCFPFVVDQANNHSLVGAVAYQSLKQRRSALLRVILRDTKLGGYKF